MQHDWMIDVLSDLRTFAKNHEMKQLADQLDDTILTAAKEMKLAQDLQGALGANEQKDSHLFRATRAN